MTAVFVPDVPGSRSIAARALICASLAHGHSLLSNVPVCDDTVAITGCVEGIGAQVHSVGTETEIAGSARVAPTGRLLDCLASGTTMRFVSALSLLTDEPMILTGTPRLFERPMAGLHDLLNQVGKQVQDSDGQRTISGTAHIPDEIGIDASSSGQFVSGLMMALATCGKSTILRASNPVSIPFIRMTEMVMKSFGAQLSVEQYGNDLVINLDGLGYQATKFAIEPDIMSANYFLAAAALSGRSVFIPNISADTIQGDIALVHVLSRMGALVEFVDGGIRCSRPSDTPLVGCTLDLSDMPDMCLTFAALATVAHGPTTMTSARILKFKESDRLSVIRTETTKLGAAVEISNDDDTIVITPSTSLNPAQIDTFDDHRVAMAYGLLTLREPAIVINDPGCVSKTWPDYFSELQRYRNV